MKKQEWEELSELPLSLYMYEINLHMKDALPCYKLAEEHSD